MIDQKLARAAVSASLVALARFTFRGYVPSWHHYRIARELEEASRTPNARLIIAMPPRHGKTELASIRFAPWLLANRPQAHVIAATYAQDFADELGRKARGVMASSVYRSLFPYAQLSGDNRAVSRWQTVSGGSYYAVGVGGALTGRGADVLLIDDPHKNRAEAESKVSRDTVWDWFRSTAYTRLEKGGSAVIIMCMTGDTQVRMADGSLRALRDIRASDRVATYDDGILAESTVVRWVNQGPDDVYAIRTRCGGVAKANARHPFLVDRGGVRKWVRLGELKTGDMLVRLRGAPIEASRASRKAATREPFARAVVRRITTSGVGAAAFARLHRWTGWRAEMPESKVDTGSRKPSIRRCWHLKTACARFVGNLRGAMLGRTGAESCVSTTIMPRVAFAGCCATTAILQSATGRTRKHSKRPQPTCDFTLDEIVSIDPCGREDVFDVQIDRTENFIAGGFVSHNTRWHEDDLVGRCLASGEPWRVLSLPAIAEHDEPERKCGEALWPDKYPVEALERIRTTVGEREWAALYQQRPAPIEGALFKPDRLTLIDSEPAGMRWVRAWDFGATAGGGDWTVGAKLGVREGRPIVADVVRIQGAPEDVERTLVATAQRDGRGVVVNLPQDPGAAGKAHVQYLTRLLSGYTVKSSPETGDKVLRAEPFASQVNVGNVSLVKGSWNAALMDEMRVFPNGMHDDQVDALSRAYGEFFAPSSTGIIDYLRGLKAAHKTESVHAAA